MTAFFVWLSSLPGWTSTLIHDSIVMAAVGASLAPGIAGIRWAWRGRTRLVAPRCARCTSLLRAVDDAIPKRCSECGSDTDEPRAIRWVQRGTRWFSLTVTLPTAAAGAAGLAYAASYWTDARIHELERSAMPAIMARARTETQTRIRDRFDAIERGDSTEGHGYQNSLASLLPSLVQMWSPEKPTSQPQQDPFVTEVLARIEAIAADPTGRLPRTTLAIQSQGPAWDLLPGLVGLVNDGILNDDDLHRLGKKLLDPIRVLMPAEVGLQQTVSIAVVPARFGINLKLVVDEFLVNGVSQPTSVDETGRTPGITWTAPAAPGVLVVGVKGTLFLGGGVMGTTLVRFGEFAADGAIRVTETPIMPSSDLLDPLSADPLDGPDGGLTAEIIPLGGRSLGWCYLRAELGVGITGVVEVREGEMWREIGRIAAPSGMSMFNWLRASDDLPDSFDLRIRPLDDGPVPPTFARTFASKLTVKHWSGDRTYRLQRIRSGANDASSSASGNAFTASYDGVLPAISGGEK